MTSAVPVRIRKVWIDLENSPHVPFFIPIIEELETRGYSVIVTARDAYQVCELLDYYELSAKVLGRHYGKNKLLKVAGVCLRAAKLAALMACESPDIGVSHGSRSQLLACFALGIPDLTLYDYEFTSTTGFIKPTWIMVPEVVPLENIKIHNCPIVKYPGIKEDVYLSRFKPSPLRRKLNVGESDLLVLLRPPATEAHYHNPESELLFKEVLDYLTEKQDARTVILPRNERQAAEVRDQCTAQLASGKMIIPDHVEDGLNLIWNSDLVISGGGTMNREAAAMGVPVYSIFRGKIGAVDRYLEKVGRLQMLETTSDVRRKLKMVRRTRSMNPVQSGASPTLKIVVENIVSMVEHGIPAFNTPAVLSEVKR